METRQMTLVRASVATIFPSVIAIFIAHEGVGMLVKLLPHFRMALHELLQLRMIGDPLLVVDELGIFAQLLVNFRMLVQKLIHSGYFAPRNSVPIPIFGPLILLFLVHDCPWILLNVSSNLGMVVQILLQRRMVFDELLVIDQRWVLAQVV